MPAPEHNLPTQFNRLDDQITGYVLDAIMIYPRSRGTLYLPGEYSTDSKPPAHKVNIGTGDPGNPGVYTQENQLGGPDHYMVNYDIWNHRDSPAFARIILTEPADQEVANTQGG
jgi:hypothetical protein